MRPPAVAALLCLVLAGCAFPGAPPEPTQAFDVPAAWSRAGPGAGEATLEQDWWLRFEDPVLAGLVERALQANMTVRGAQAALREARAQRDVSSAALYPTLGATASGQRSKAGHASSVNGFRAGLDAGWELDLFGANRSALQASEAAALASEATLAGTRVSLAAEVTLDYIGLRGSQARLAIAQDNLAIQQETLQITQWRRQAGLVTALEEEQARASVAQTGAQLPALETAIAQARHALAVLTGQPPDSLAQALAPAGPIPQVAFDLALGIPADTLRQRPDVHAAELQVAAAHARVGQAQAARYPDLTLGGSIGLSALTVGSLFDGAALASSLLASVALPLFDAGARRAQVSARQAAMDQSQAAYEGTVLVALKEVEDALVALRGDRERLQRLAVAAEAAGNASLLARQRYGSGLADFQVVLDTQRTQLSTQDGLAVARADVSADHVRLVKALGGGWRAGPDPVPEADPNDSRKPRP